MIRALKAISEIKKVGVVQFIVLVTSSLVSGICNAQSIGYNPNCNANTTVCTATDCGELGGTWNYKNGTCDKKPPQTCSIVEQNAIAKRKKECELDKVLQIRRLKESITQLVGANARQAVRKRHIDSLIARKGELDSVGQLAVQSAGYVGLAVLDVVPAKTAILGTKAVCTGTVLASQVVFAGGATLKSGVLYVNTVTGGNVAKAIGEKSVTIALTKASKPGTWSDWTAWIPIYGRAKDANVFIKDAVYNKDEVIANLSFASMSVGGGMQAQTKLIKEHESDIRKYEETDCK